HGGHRGKAGEEKNALCRESAEIHDRTLLHAKPLGWITGFHHVGITAYHNPDRTRIRTGSQCADHLIGFKPQRKESVPRRSFLRRDVNIGAAAVAFFEFDRVVMQLFHRMDGRGGLQDVAFVMAWEREVETKMRFHGRGCSAAANSCARSRTLLTCMGSGNRLPSSISGISLSKSGPEAAPISMILTG